MTITHQSCYLKNIATFLKGKPPAIIPYYEEDACLYLSPEFLRGKDSAELAKPSSNSVFVDDGDLIVLWDGSNAGEFFKGRRGLLASTMSLIQHGDEIDKQYFLYALKSWESYLKGQTSGSGIPHVDKEVLGNLKILVFCKEEQEKIAEVLSTIDRAIAQTEAIIAKQQRIKTGLMQDLLTKGIDENGNIRSEATHEFKNSAIGRIPVEWDVELLDKLGERGSGHTPNKSHPTYWNGGIKWVSLADSSKLDQIYISDTDKEISTQGLKNSSAVLHPKGTVILSRDAGVGKSAILGTEMAVSQHFIVWRCGKNLNNYYLYYWLQKEKPKFEGIASGSTIVTIGLQFFRQYQIAVPKLIDEHNLIAEIIKKSDESISKHRCSLEKLKRRKIGLMQDLLTGKVRVTNLLNQKEEAN